MLERQQLQIYLALYLAAKYILCSTVWAAKLRCKPHPLPRTVNIAVHFCVQSIPVQSRVQILYRPHYLGPKTSIFTFPWKWLKLEVHVRATVRLLFSAPDKCTQTSLAPLLDTVLPGTMSKYMGISSMFIISSGGYPCSCLKISLSTSFIAWLGVLADWSSHVQWEWVTSKKPMQPVSWCSKVGIVRWY